MDAFVKIQQVSLERSIRGGLWPLFEPFGDRSKKYGDVIKEWVTPLVERALEHKRKMSEKGQQIQNDQSTFLEYLAYSFDGNLPFWFRTFCLSPTDVAVIRDQLINLLLAARDTVCSSISAAAGNTLITAYRRRRSSATPSICLPNTLRSLLVSGTK